MITEKQAMDRYYVAVVNWTFIPTPENLDKLQAALALLNSFKGGTHRV